jgi:hypothetical protein
VCGRWFCSTGTRSFAFSIALTAVTASVAVCVSYARIDVNNERIRKRLIFGTTSVRFQDIRLATLDTRSSSTEGFGSTSLQFRFHVSAQARRAALVFQPESWQHHQRLIDRVEGVLGKRGLRSVPSESLTRTGRKTMSGKTWER